MEETKQTDENQLQNEPAVKATEEVAKTDEKPISEATTPAQQETPSQEIKDEHPANGMVETTSQPMENGPQPTADEAQAAPIAQVPPFVSRATAPSSVPPTQNPGVFVPAGDGVRKLRKIKRPIKRVPQGNPLSPSSSQMINLEENLDELLDSQLNLPVLNSAANKSSSAGNFQTRGLQSQPSEKPRQQPRFINESDLATAPRFIDQLMVDNLFTYKGAAVIAVAVFILTLIIGMFIFGGETVVKDGLQGVIVNAEVPRGRARCGIAERTQGCVLYIMNPQRQDLQGRDFYDLASQLTGRQRFVVETGNMRYSNVKIRAGEIAQINIPPLQ